jgi:hypothetical protein
MNILKIVYYIFGAFIGFVCGTIINIIFYWLDESGVKFAENLVKNYGAFGKFLLEMVNYLPLFGVALGIIIVQLFFGKELDSKRS